MLSTILVLGAVLAGLLLLLVLIVSLSARPATRSRGTGTGRSWVNDAGRAHPDAWSPMTSTTTSEIQAIR